MSYYSEYTTWAPEPPRCTECRKPFPAEQLSQLPGEPAKDRFCPACTADFLASSEADKLGDCAIDAILDATHVGEMRDLLVRHISTCRSCGGIPPLAPIAVQVAVPAIPEWQKGVA
jgi:hypothetical protein